MRVCTCVFCVCPHNGVLPTCVLFFLARESHLALFPVSATRCRRVDEFSRRLQLLLSVSIPRQPSWAPNRLFQFNTRFDQKRLKRSQGDLDLIRGLGLIQGSGSLADPYWDQLGGIPLDLLLLSLRPHFSVWDPSKKHPMLFLDPFKDLLLSSQIPPLDWFPPLCLRHFHPWSCPAAPRSVLTTPGSVSTASRSTPRP